ncbi:hypothetical protein ALO49_200146 [Pseudomonas savastanoi pv. retacarpa]|nr:hypothetical protein ALO49_200146 [Pseudomonas savastanoi pv. retacarpa]
MYRKGRQLIVKQKFSQQLQLTRYLITGPTNDIVLSQKLHCLVQHLYITLPDCPLAFQPHKCRFYCT